MRIGRYGKDDKRWLNPNARAILGLLAIEAVLLGAFALVFFRGWYSAAIVLLVLAFVVLPLAWLLAPLFRKR